MAEATGGVASHNPVARIILVLRVRCMIPISDVVIGICKQITQTMLIWMMAMIMSLSDLSWAELRSELARELS